MSEAHEGNVLTTYRSLRVAMIPLLLILVVATALETIRGQVCVLGSISAYFHTPVRGAFVLALAGLGACLIAYKGNDPVEDVLLNFAGFMAFLVALVPTTVDTTCVTKYGNVVADTNTADAVRNNVLTLLLVSVVAICLYRLTPKLVAAAKKRRGLAVVTPVPLTLNDDDKKALKLARLLGSVALVIVIVELALFGFWPSTFKDVAHGISAITMVLGVLGVMVANARGFARATRGIDDPPARHWNNRYAVAAATTLALIVLAILTMRSQPAPDPRGRAHRHRGVRGLLVHADARAVGLPHPRAEVAAGRPSVGGGGTRAGTRAGGARRASAHAPAGGARAGREADESWRRV